MYSSQHGYDTNLKPSTLVNGTKYDQHSHFLPLKWSCNPSCRSLFVLTQHWATASVLLAMEVSSEERSASSCEGWDLHRAVSVSLAASMSALCCCTMPWRSWKAMERLYVYSQEELHSGGKSKLCDACWIPLRVGSRAWLKRMMLWCREGRCHKSAETINWVICIWIIWVLHSRSGFILFWVHLNRESIFLVYIFCFYLIYSQKTWKHVWLNELWDAESINNMSHLKCSNVAVRCGTGEVR